jgi:hypothetical protein
MAFVNDSMTVVVDGYRHGTTNSNTTSNNNINSSNNDCDNDTTNVNSNITTKYNTLKRQCLRDNLCTLPDIQDMTEYAYEIVTFRNIKVAMEQSGVSGGIVKHYKDYGGGGVGGGVAVYKWCETLNEILEANETGPDLARRLATFAQSTLPEPRDIVESIVQYNSLVALVDMTTLLKNSSSSNDEESEQRGKVERSGASKVAMLIPSIRQEAASRLSKGVVGVVGEIEGLCGVLFAGMERWLVDDVSSGAGGGQEPGDDGALTDALTKILISASSVGEKSVVDVVMQAAVETVLEKVLEKVELASDISVESGEALVSILERVLDVYECAGLESLRTLLGGSLKDIERTWTEGGWEGLERSVVAGVIRKTFEQSEKRERVVGLVLDR